HDSRVVHDALTRRNGLRVPQEFGDQGRAPANEVQFFNLRHPSLRNVIERIF
ncbi:PREDICTED: putative nuclease HARBI1, partial [Prunus dulcis]